jgi:hypothetical protein
VNAGYLRARRTGTTTHRRGSPRLAAVGVTTGGAAPIGAIAREVGWSHKHLISKFKQQLGPVIDGRPRRRRDDAG